MRFTMQSGENKNSLIFTRWKNALIGEEIDYRGKEAALFVKENADKIHTISFCPKKLNYIYNKKYCTHEEFVKIIKDLCKEPILIEATTLKFVELLQTLRVIHELSFEATILYLEPRYYMKPRPLHVLHRRDFELSEEVELFSGVPGSIIRLREDRPVIAVFLLGYEGQRLARALSENNIKPSKCYAVFGVPAFQPGWEMNSFANNVDVINEQGLHNNILYASAYNPYTSYNIIRQVYDSCDKKKDERLIIAPIGTKPHAIGAALFACDHKDIGLIYDHPHKKIKRTNEVSKWHLYKITY